MQGSTIDQLGKTMLRVGETETSMDKGSSAHTHSTPHTLSLGKVAPKSILVAEQVLPRLLAPVQKFIVARRARI
jgi:hypothetical protein